MASNKSHSSGVTRQAMPAPPQVAQATQTQNGPQMSPIQPVQVNTMNPATANQTPNDQNTPVQPGAITALTQMSDDELAQLVNDSKSVIMPNHLADIDDPTQKFVYQAGLNAMPQVLDAAAFQQFMQDNGISQSEVLARSVDPITVTVPGGSGYQPARLNYTAQMITDMMMYSKFNYIGGKHGGQVYGAGTYFAMTGGKNTGYGGHTVQAVLNPATTRMISKSQLQRQAQSFAASHPKFAQAVGGYKHNNISIWALCMGYNVISDGYNTNGAYRNVIDRSALVYRK